MKKIIPALLALCALLPAMAMDRPANLNEQLVLAIQRGKLEQVRALLAQGADPNAHDGFCCALARAAHRGYEEIVQLLIDHGADARAQGDHHRGSYLIAAVSSDKIENIRIAQLLIKHGAPVNAKDEGHRTALIKAAAPNFFHACQLLLENGAELEAADKYGNTALHHAAIDGADTAIPILLTCIPQTVQNNFYGLLAMHHALPELPPEIHVMITNFLIWQLIEDHMQLIIKTLGMKNRFNQTPQEAANQYFLRPQTVLLLDLQNPKRYAEVCSQAKANIKRTLFSKPLKAAAQARKAK